jgi:hypothetical protein
MARAWIRPSTRVRLAVLAVVVVVSAWLAVGAVRVWQIIHAPVTSLTALEALEAALPSLDAKYPDGQVTILGARPERGRGLPASVGTEVG